MQLTKTLTPERIRVPMEATEKFAAIAELIAVLDSTGGLTDCHAALEAVRSARPNERPESVTASQYRTRRAMAVNHS